MGASSSNNTSTNTSSIFGIFMQALYAKCNINGNVLMGINNNVNINFDLPHASEIFHGRDEEFDKLESLLFKDNFRKIVIYGLGGIGKSEFANQFARRCLKKGNINRAYWVNLETGDCMETLQYLKEFYKSADKTCLFIFDGPPNIRHIGQYEPTDSNHILLITHRKRNWKNITHHFELKSLDTKFSIDIIKSTLGDSYFEVENKPLYEELVKFFDNVPLISHLLAQDIQTKILFPIENFELEIYVKNIKKLDNNSIISKTLDEDDDNTTYSDSFYNIVNSLLNTIRNNRNISPSVLPLHILYFLIFLNPACIHCKSLLNLLKINKIVDENNAGNVSNAIKLMDNILLINYIREFKLIKMKTIIQQIIKSDLVEDSEKKSRWYEYCLQFVLTNDPDYIYHHFPTVLQDADENIDTFSNFYFHNRTEISQKTFEINQYKDTQICTDECENKTDRFKDKKPLQKIILENLIKSDCLKSLKIIFHNSHELVEKHINKYNLLHVAVKHNKLHILKELLKYNVDVNCTNEDSDTPLHIAAFHWNFKAINILKQKKGNLSLINSYKKTPYYEALRGAPNIENRTIEEYNRIEELLL